jgi:hypothetical protein
VRIPITRKDVRQKLGARSGDRNTGRLEIDEAPERSNSLPREILWQARLRITYDRSHDHGAQSELRSSRAAFGFAAHRTAISQWDGTALTNAVSGTAASQSGLRHLGGS